MINQIIKELEIERIKSLLDDRKYFWLSVRGKSMEPVLRADYKVKIRKVDVNKIKVGDIIVFGRGQIVCHRVIRRLKFFNETYFIHKGDNVVIGDIVTGSDLIGKVETIIDDKKQEINKEAWQYRAPNMKRFAELHYIYLICVLVKKRILKERRNKFTELLKRIFWKII
ncbi:MAG: hypothetical protein KJ952_06750, partial [Candidatus Omnitrophica bacterium]|nr:hypothetical protein [Candidatus Omnitrophota bacterium]